MMKPGAMSAGLRVGPFRHRGPALVVATVVAVSVCAAVLWWGGSISAGYNQPYDDPGLSPWMLPLSRLGMHAAAVATVGCLVAAAFLVPGERVVTKSGPGPLLVSQEASGWVRAASWSALGWVAMTLMTICFNISMLVGAPVATAMTRQNMRIVLLQLPPGQALLVSLALAAVVAAACRAVTSLTATALVAVLAVLAALPSAFTGHAASRANHQVAVAAMVLHVAGAVLWVGALVALLLVRRRSVRALSESVRRFSALALCCFVLIGFTGLITAPLRFSSWEDLSSAYAVVVGLKLVALAVLGGFGWWHRRVSLPALARGQAHIFARIAWVEVLVMAAALGLAAGLGRTLPPNTYRVREQVETPVQRLVDGLPNPLFLAVAVAAVACYLIGVRRLRRAGQAWPVGRTLAWIIGWAMVVAATDVQLVRLIDGMFAGSGPAEGDIGVGQGLQHLAIIVVAPVVLAFGAAARLAERSLRAAHEPGMRGPVEWLDVARESAPMRVLCHPAAAFAGYATVLYGAYVSARLGFGVAAPSAQMVIFAVGLAWACLFHTVLVAGGSMRDRVGGPARMVLGVATVVVGVALGVADIMGTPLPVLAAVLAVTVGILSAIVWMIHRISRTSGRPSAPQRPVRRAPPSTEVTITPPRIRVGQSGR